MFLLIVDFFPKRFESSKVNCFEKNYDKEHLWVDIWYMGLDVKICIFTKENWFSNPYIFATQYGRP